MSSLIYNIFTNDSLDHSTSGLFLKDTSDHLRQYFPLFQEQNVENNKYFLFRDKNPPKHRKIQIRAWEC